LFVAVAVAVAVVVVVVVVVLVLVFVLATRNVLGDGSSTTKMTSVEAAASHEAVRV